jgi:nitrite reductase/ring-hydroxylating ferredoxin subunit/uncharacterized membrane protein
VEIDRRRVERLIRQKQVRERTLDRVVRRQGWLEPVAEAVQKAVGAFYGALGAPGRTLKDALTGTTVLGHPLHPALTDVPLGAWTVGVVADWIFVATGRLPASAGDVALGIGVAAAVLSAMSGLTDFHGTSGHQRRTAIVHGLTMTSVLVVESVSLGVRVWGSPEMHLLAVVLASAGYLLALGGAYVGGHLAFAMGTVVNHNAFFDGPADFVRVGTRTDFPEGEMKRVDAAGLPVVILRHNGLLRAMGAVCAHAGGPLEEGKLVEDGKVVECPWHYSRFRFEDARVVGGPATFDQPSLIVRERGGIVEVKLAHPIP